MSGGGQGDIGLISPDVHWYFRRRVPMMESRESIGLPIP
jgi:hypothetical protein